MAWFVPVALAVGTAVAAKGAYDQGQYQKAEYKLQGKLEGDAARGREIERKRELIKAISAQNAQAGAQGVALQGSNVAIANRDINDYRQDLMYDSANSKTRQRIFRARGQNASYQGTMSAISTALDGASNTYNALPA